MMGDTKKTLLFLFLFAALAHASCMENIVETVMLEQGIIIGVVIMLTIVVIAIAYAAGSFTGNCNAMIRGTPLP
jgi:hypothetical protein